MQSVKGNGPPLAELHCLWRKVTDFTGIDCRPFLDSAAGKLQDCTENLWLVAAQHSSGPGLLGTDG